MSELASLLEQVPFFQGVPRDALAGVANDSFQKRFRSGDRIVTQGEYGHTMFVILHGGLKVLLTLEDGSEREITRLDQPGQFFGELSLISNARRSASVISDGESLVLEIQKQRVEALAKDHKQVLSALEALYEKRTIATYIHQCGHFVGLDPKIIDELVRESSLKVLARDDTVYKAGDANDSLMLALSGHLKMTRASGSRMNVLAYFNAGDFFGVPDEGPQRSATVTALGKAEVIRIPSSVVKKQLMSSAVIQERLRKVTFARREAMFKVLGAGETVALAAQQMMLDGQVEAASLLIINLETCVRCGNCSASCHDRHGASRLARRGKKIRRRVGGFQKGQHQHVLVPSSCYHCANPECMVGCPTGAIHREKDGEVNIYDFCIGCTNCARRCPYDNITMAERSDAGVLDAAGKKKSKQIASKCDLCSGYSDAACVSNCPTGACMRVDPKVYFEEVAALRQGALEGQQAKARSTGDYTANPIPVLIGAMVVAFGMLATYILGAQPRHASSGSGLSLGIFAFMAILGATALAGRRRVRKFRLGSLQRWTQIHIALGALGFFAALLHANFHMHGWISSTLLLVFGGVFLSGCFGQLVYTYVPPIVTRIEGDKSLLVEDVVNERKQLSKELASLCDSAPMRAVANESRRHAGGIVARSGATYNSEKFVEKILSQTRLEHLVGQLPPDRRVDGRRVVSDVIRLRDWDVTLRLYQFMRVWLAVHISATMLLLALLFTHVGGVLLWFI